MTIYTEELLKRFQNGDRVALSRIISLVENDHADSGELLDALYPCTGRALRIGVTGPPGAGKSTLVDQLALEMRRSSLRVGIVAVDPTSPFSGGALLGDRVRMSSVGLDEGVFIRSMATRGSTGGVAWKTLEVCEILDAFGVDRIVVETVGVGQGELEIADAVHSTVVVLVPESGDGVQAMKAGLMEIGDVFVINKSDRENAELAKKAVEAALELKDAENGWRPHVLSTVALDGRGIVELNATIEERLQFLLSSGKMEKRRAECVRAKITGLLKMEIVGREWRRGCVGEILESEVACVMAGTSTPYRAARRILERLAGGTG
ncbi:MAG: methylmalonyl Co-A mutase-associated GTPase MeaB [Candidatus Eisenbacteria bacterium]